jgi:hypothetical protein
MFRTESMFLEETNTILLAPYLKGGLQPYSSIYVIVCYDLLFCM